MARGQQPSIATERQALAFVRKHGVVLESARGPVPSLAEAIAGGPIRGGWWGHPSGRTIFALTRAIRDDDNVLVCRIVGGKVTFVHARLWPSLVRLAPRFPKRSLARFVEVHSATGQHVIRTKAFPNWVTPAVRRAATRLSEENALRALGAWTRDL